MAKALARVSNGYDENRLTSHWTGTKRAPKVATVAPPSIEIKGRVLARVADYQDLWGAVRNRVDELGLTREELDHLSGNQPGYSGKILGPKQVKKMGKHSLGNTLGGTGTFLLLVEDPVQTARILARAKKRTRPLRTETANAQ